MPIRQLRARACALALTLFATAAPARATWSILIVDTRTGEIAIASATCLTSLDLRSVTPVLLVNRGAATAQASVNIGSITNRLVIWNGLRQDLTPTQILAALAGQDAGHQSRQYGIVDVRGGKVTFSGTANSAYAGGAIGSVGTIHYAVQGNILTGRAVVTAAEQAILNTPGDLAAKLMASMEAARQFGGDGRCSCSASQPTSCGAPPPSFTKAAHIGYMIVARQGDVDGTCSSPSVGCASGTYWLNLNVANQTTGSLDPVLQLRTRYDAWRNALIGRPDHHLSRVSVNPARLIADGAAQATVRIALRDWRDQPLTTGGATIVATLDPSSTTTATLGAVTDHGDGTYSLPITAGTTPGELRLSLRVDNGPLRVLLTPRTEIAVRSDTLWAATDTLDVRAGGSVDLRLNATAAEAGRLYALAMSASGTSPGTPLPPIVIPLNYDALFETSLLFANSALFVNTVGALDATGRASARFVAPANVLAPLLGRDLDFAFAILQPTSAASNPVRVGLR